MCEYHSRRTSVATDFVWRMRKEMGTATYEDFAAIFGNPVAAPRQSG